MSNEMTVDVHRWYVIHTKPKEEDRADSNLRAWKVETFSPRIKEHRYNQYTGKMTYLIKPLFPRYIFARFNASTLLHKVHYTRGVHSVVSFGERPTPVEDETIAVIQSRVGKEGLIVVGEEFNPGDEVTIKQGPLKGINGIFDRAVKDTDRVMILLTTVKYQASITIESELIKKIAPAVCTP